MQEGMPKLRILFLHLAFTQGQGTSLWTEPHLRISVGFLGSRFFDFARGTEATVLFSGRFASPLTQTGRTSQGMDVLGQAQASAACVWGTPLLCGDARTWTKDTDKADCKGFAAAAFPT